MKPRLYLETTIPSYLVAWPSRDLIVAGHQQITVEWWRKRRNAFDLYISQFVLDEVAAGDTQAASSRIDAIRGLPSLEVTPASQELASSLVVLGVIPKSAATDAAHIAVAAVHHVDYLMTWNCTHIANAVNSKRVEIICRQHGVVSPVICTPEALMGE